MKGTLSYLCVSQTMSVPAEKLKAGAHRKGGPVLMRAKSQKLCVGTRESCLFFKGLHKDTVQPVFSRARWVHSISVFGRGKFGFVQRESGRWSFRRVISSKAVWCVCVRALFKFIQRAWLTVQQWAYPTMVLTKLAQSVCMSVYVRLD